MAAFLGRDRYERAASVGTRTPGMRNGKAESGGTVVYPRVTAERPRLRFHRILDDGELELGAFGILEPSPSSPEVRIEALDVVLVPGLAFDLEGRRLGYGGGYYDEVAALLRAAGRGFLVGVGFDFQIVERCPADGAT